MNWYIDAMKKYADFNGRARRKEYWMFMLFNIIFSFVFGFIAGLLKVPALASIYSLATLIPILSVTVRRMHDTDRSGWWCIVPVAGLVFLFLDGQRQDNRFGVDPKSL